jgi:membrane-bound inhibitor of C-type lysozyme
MSACRLLSLLPLALALAACNTLWAGNPTRTNDIGVGISSEPPPQRGEVRQVSYACEGDLTLTATFDDWMHSVTVMQPGMAPVTLTAQIAGSGFGYADKTHEFIGKDKNALWTQNGNAKRCTASS